MDCPYCLAEVENSQAAAKCVSCGAVYHEECWSENDGCCVKQCAATVRRLELDIPDKETGEVVITREAAESAIPHVKRKAWNPCLRCGRHVSPDVLYCRECMPEREASQDSRNVGPLLIALALLALTLAGIYLFASAGPSRQGQQQPTQIEGTLNQ